MAATPFSRWPRQHCRSEFSLAYSASSTACAIRLQQRCRYDRRPLQNRETHRWRRDKCARKRAERCRKRSGQLARPHFAAGTQHRTRTGDRNYLESHLRWPYTHGRQAKWGMSDKEVPVQANEPTGFLDDCKCRSRIRFGNNPAAVIGGLGEVEKTECSFYRD